MSHYLIAIRSEDEVTVCKFMKSTHEDVLFNAGFPYTPSEIISGKMMPSISLFANRNFPKFDDVVIKDFDNASTVTFPVQLIGIYLPKVAASFNISNDALAKIFIC